MGKDAACTPLELAVLAELAVIPVREAGVIEYVDPALWVGPGANEDVIATIACRRKLARADNDVTEDAVRSEVEREGYSYVPWTPVLRPIASARPDNDEADNARLIG
jgi:hypothetical protein